MTPTSLGMLQLSIKFSIIFLPQLDLVGLLVQPRKCVVWSPLGLPTGFYPPSDFYIVARGIKVLGVPLGFFSFTFIFYKRFWTMMPFLGWGMCMWHLGFSLVVLHRGLITFFIFSLHF
jgi:hypothetical protein